MMMINKLVISIILNSFENHEAVFFCIKLKRIKRLVMVEGRRRGGGGAAMSVLS